MLATNDKVFFMVKKDLRERKQTIGNEYMVMLINQWFSKS